MKNIILFLSIIGFISLLIATLNNDDHMPTLFIYILMLFMLLSIISTIIGFIYIIITFFI